MKLRRKRVIFWAMAVLVIVLVIIVLAFMLPEDPREAKARRLIAELREPGKVREWLIDIGLLESRRDPGEIAKDLVALGHRAVPACVEALEDENDLVRYHAADALGKIAQGAQEAVPALTDRLKDENGNVRCAAAGALAKLGLSQRGLPVLIAELEDELGFCRTYAAWTLGEIGPPAKPAVPALKEALKDEDEYVRKVAAWALKKIQTRAPATRAATATQPGGKQ